MIPLSRPLPSFPLVSKHTSFRRCAPSLTPPAAEALSSHFVSLRRTLHTAEISAGTRSTIPLTVRQLEAIIRIAESLAKLQLSPIATEDHVNEAIRLFLASTMDAVSRSGGGAESVGGQGQGREEQLQEVKRVEEELRKRLPVGWGTSLQSLKREFVDGRGYSEGALGRALQVLQRREVVQMRQGGAQVFRSGV